ncbi:MAG: p-hydroxycinnamoyl-CoA synthetase, partial [Sedimentisphaerales bacterium]|nr:p-hydroxycinnamoyl-CoA synthetase [Sedimentisphaerales bacterium]
VSILEVEDALMQVPGIHQAAVIPVEDHTLGQALEAFVVPAKDIFLQEETIRRQLSQSLSRFKIPRCIHICEALPMDPSGKVIKSRLQAHPKA